MSGKQTLLYLLDGHPDLLVNFIHDQFLLSLESIQKDTNLDLDSDLVINDDLKKKDIFIHSVKKNKKLQLSIIDFIKSIYKSNIAHLERLSFLKLMPNYFSIYNKSYLDFHFNYSQFYENLKSKVFKKKIISLEEVYNIYIDCFSESWENGKNLNFNKSYFVTKLSNHINSIKFVLEEGFDCKIIYIQRDLIGLSKSRALNLMKLNNLGSNYLDSYFDFVINSYFIEKIINNEKIIEELIKKYPSKICKTSLERLIKDTNHEMIKIYNFIGVNSNLALTFPSYLGNKIGLEKHTEKIQDDHYELSRNNLIKANIRINGFGFLKTLSIFEIILNFFIILKSFYFNIKYSFKKKLIKDNHED
jgi:hypothetical protein